MDVDLRILRFDPETDRKPYWERFTVASEPMDRVLDLLHRVKWEHDGRLTFRRSCAHGVCGSDAMMINGRNRLACKIRVDQLGRRISVAPMPGLPVIKDLVVDMDGFFANYRSVMPFLVNDEPPPERERLQSQHDREHFDDTTKCILCAACTLVLPVVLGATLVRRPGRDRQRAPLHLRHARPRRRRAAGHPVGSGGRVALPHDLQLHRCLPARNQHHAGHPRGLGRHRGAQGLSQPSAAVPRILIRSDGAARGNPGPAAAGAVLIDLSRADAHDPDCPPVAVIARPLGTQTNNYAEYTGVILALEKATALGAREVELVLDSQLIVEQLSGRWKVRHPQIAPLAARARELLAGFERWSIRHERRASNRAADALANLALDDPAAAAAAEAGAETAPPVTGDSADPGPGQWQGQHRRGVRDLRRAGPRAARPAHLRTSSVGAAGRSRVARRGAPRRGQRELLEETALVVGGGR